MMVCMNHDEANQGKTRYFYWYLRYKNIFQFLLSYLIYIVSSIHIDKFWNIAKICNYFGVWIVYRSSVKVSINKHDIIHLLALKFPRHSPETGPNPSQNHQIDGLDRDWVVIACVSIQYQFINLKIFDNTVLWRTMQFSRGS